MRPRASGPCLDARAAYWRDAAERIHADTCANAWNASLGRFAATWGGDGADADGVRRCVEGVEHLPRAEPLHCVWEAFCTSSFAAALAQARVLVDVCSVVAASAGRPWQGDRLGRDGDPNSWGSVAADQPHRCSTR